MKAPCLVTTFLLISTFFGTACTGAIPVQEEAVVPFAETVTIPGPLRPFLRMAGISQQILPQDVLPLLARNVLTRGYKGWQDNHVPTEFLVLLSRYVEQARELTNLAGADAVIRVSNCDQAPPLLHILGYRFRGGCGTALEAANPERAFLTIDAGFPLVDLEEDLHVGKPFIYPFPSSPVPVLFRESDWTSIPGVKAQNILDTLLQDPALARLYAALSHIDPETRVTLKRSPGLSGLMPVSAALDFYGAHIAIRSGRISVPGGAPAEAAWKDLVGAGTAPPGEFVLKLLSKDKGWLAAYFDALSRSSHAEQAYFCEPHRLRRFYEALRGQDPTPEAYKGVFRPDSGLLLLVSRLRLGPAGEAQVPGNLEVWKEIFRQKNDSKIVRNLGKHSGNWTTADQLVEALFAASRVETDSGPLQIYLMVSELDAERSPGHRLTPETVRLLANKYKKFSDQYLIFSEFPDLDNGSIVRFLAIAEGVDRIRDQDLRGNAMGTLQGNVGLWQILVRQGEIPKESLNGAWQQVIAPFAGISSATQLFDAGRVSLRGLLEATTGKPSCSQDEIIDLLAGPQQSSPEARQVHEELAKRLRGDLDGQRLVSLDTILVLGQELDNAARTGSASAVATPLAGELREFEMPRPIFSRSEKTEWAATGAYGDRHTDAEMHTDLAKLIKSHPSAEQLAKARGELAPFLRDTLVGLNYAYYEPPGAQILHHNPLLVRSHDFAGQTVSGLPSLWRTPQLFGVGSPAGGGAHLVGSLANLPYVLAEAEEDFIAPENVQALIWKETVSVLLSEASLSRWWNVSRNELHAVALYQQAGEELVMAAAKNEQLHDKVLTILEERMTPARMRLLETALRGGNLAEAPSLIMPADTFYLEAEFHQRFYDDGDSGPAAKELAVLAREHPAEVSWSRLSRDFGVPHPSLAQSYARELLNVPPFPACEGYGSRLLAESWDSNYLYWARLADGMGYSPVMLNKLVPTLTHRMVENIFATDPEDWPALLRALRQTGEEFRHGKTPVVAP